MVAAVSFETQMFLYSGRRREQCRGAVVWQHANTAFWGQMCSRTHYRGRAWGIKKNRPLLLWHCKHSVNLRVYWLLSNYAGTQRTAWKQALHEIPLPPLKSWQTRSDKIKEEKKNHLSVWVYSFNVRLGEKGRSFLSCQDGEARRAGATCSVSSSSVRVSAAGCQRNICCAAVTQRGRGKWLGTKKIKRLKTHFKSGGRPKLEVLRGDTCDWSSTW